MTSTKMQLGLQQTEKWIERLLLPRVDRLADVSFCLCLPFPVLLPAIRSLEGTGIVVGAQNLWYEGGAVSGEVSAELLAETGCGAAMIGHTERRRLFGEDDALVARKARAAADTGLLPVVCVGEPEPVPSTEAAAHVRRQAMALRDALPSAAPVTVLYEPGWAVGADKGADPDHAASALEALREVLSPDLRGGDTRFLYGGAVVPGSYSALRGAAPWDGVAVGRAARDPAQLDAVLAELLDGGA
ncbi:triose-phosphate isomerase family protein [Streptomyces sp. NPDC005012]|uniref:triose-phosphate isomerase n=1 Tax=Streptomyces sp. NPDC005012 TaxID=3154558 RepID=UPI0033B1AD42